MRVIPPVHILPWLLGLTILGLMPPRVHAWDSEKSKPGKAAGAPRAVKKEDLRYDGKPFSYWRHYWPTEQKLEGRIDSLRAMPAFGTNGYAEEATAAIIELISEYRDVEFLFLSEGGTRDEQLLWEALKATAKIGPDAA